MMICANPAGTVFTILFCNDKNSCSLVQLGLNYSRSGCVTWENLKGSWSMFLQAKCLSCHQPI